MHSISKSKSSHASIHRRILSLIHPEQYHTYNITNTSKTPAHDGYRRGRWTPKEKEPSHDHSSSEIPGEPARYWRTCAPMQTSTDGRACPPHRYGDAPPPRGPRASGPSLPTRLPPKKVRVNDRLAPHQPAPPDRQRLLVPPRRSPVPDMAHLVKQVSSSADSTMRMRDRHRPR